MMTDLLLAILDAYGLKEVSGKDSNPQILEFFKELDYDWVNDDSTTAWCSAMLSFYAKECGYEYNKTLAARDWLKMPIKVLKPSKGDIVILWRGSSQGWQGHVGLFVNWDDKVVRLLGGNQDNAINITEYPRDRILGIRQLKKIKE